MFDLGRLRMLRKCLRWRTVALTLLLVIVTLNVFVFLTLPTSRQSEVYTGEWGSSNPRRPRYDSQAVSHLQAPRKRLNKSNFTSDSLGADGTGGGGRGGGGGVGGGGGGGAAWEEGIGDHPPLLVHGQGRGFEPQQGEKGDAASRAEGSKKMLGNRNSSFSSWRKNNFTDPLVDAFVKMLGEKGLLDLPFSPQGSRGLKEEDYWTYLKRQRLRRKAGIQLPSYKNYKASQEDSTTPHPPQPQRMTPHNLGPETPACP